MECTWTGRGKEISTKLGDSELMKITKSSLDYNIIIKYHIY